MRVSLKICMQLVIAEGKWDDIFCSIVTRNKSMLPERTPTPHRVPISKPETRNQEGKKVEGVGSH